MPWEPILITENEGEKFFPRFAWKPSAASLLYQPPHPWGASDGPAQCGLHTHPPSFSPSSPQNPLVQPIITPRFAPTCSPQLLKGLGQLACETGVNIQSHICEQKDEVEYTLGLFPEHEHCASIFDKNDLLTKKVRVCVYSECTQPCLREGLHILHVPWWGY